KRAARRRARRQAPRKRAARQRARRRQRGRHEQGLRDRGVADLVGVARGPGPDQVAACQLGGGAEPLGDPGYLKPGGEEARRLRALPGCGDDKHPYRLPCRTPPHECRTVRSWPPPRWSIPTNEVNPNVTAASQESAAL